MSGLGWIDEFFRRRLERRTFPVEKGEFEEMRALIHERNSTTTLVRGGGFSKWWLSALLPMAGVLWWAFSEKGSAADEQFVATTENGANNVEQHAAEVSNALAQTEVDPSGALVDEADPYSDEVSSPRATEHIGSAGVVAAAPTQQNERSQPSSYATSVSTDDGVKALNSYVKRASHDRLARTTATDIGGSPTEQLSASALGADQVGQANEDDMIRSGEANEKVASNDAPTASIDDRIGTGSDGSGLNTLDVPTDPSSAPSGLRTELDRSEMDAVAFMQPRWPLEGTSSAPEPITSEIPVFKRVPMGELHAFGAPLLVRGRSSGGERSGMEAGSLVGLEYRVRVKRFSWATGIHYGSYGLKADGGAAAVKLSFVEVPVLASVRLGRGRFGVLVQGGLSMDLLFNARGRYPAGEDQAGTAFPDEAFRTANYSWSLCPRATYQVSERLSVNAGPLWKSQIAEVAKTGPLDGTTIHSSGISVGISWRLEHATF